MGFNTQGMGAIIHGGGTRGGSRGGGIRGGGAHFIHAGHAAHFAHAGIGHGGRGWGHHIASHYAKIGGLRRAYERALANSSAWGQGGGGAGWGGSGGDGGASADNGGGDSGAGGDNSSLLAQLQQQIQQLTDELQQMQQAQSAGVPAPDATPTGTAAASQSLSAGTNGSTATMKGLGDFRFGGGGRFGDDRFPHMGWGNRPWNWLHPHVRQEPWWMRRW